MPPVIQKIIAVTVKNANVGEYVKVNNLTSGGQFYARIQGDDRIALVNQDDDFTWNNGDTIQAEIHGRINGVARGKIQAGGANLTIDTSTDTATPGADL
mgnify:CR=1 FL=1